MSGGAAGDLADLLRWQDDGGTWMILKRSPDSVVISLRTCGGDEEMAQLSSRDPAVIAYVSQRPDASATDADRDVARSVTSTDQGRPTPDADPKGAHPVTNLQRLYSEQGQSPWLDNLTRDYLTDGTLARMVADGIRGVTANPTIFARAIESSTAYDEQLATLTAAGRSVERAYWEMVIADVTRALALLRPVHDAADGTDGFVSLEVAPEIAHDTAATIAAARSLHRQIDQPNLFVKIPATPEGIPAIRAMIGEGRSINITLIFSLTRYTEVIEAYLSGLETFTAAGGDPARVHSVASFFVSRVDTEVDHRLEAIGTPQSLQLRGQAAVAQARLAYQLFTQRFSGPRWDRLAALGAHPQLPLWASTSTKNPAKPDTTYVDQLIGPNTINTLPEPTITAFQDHGTLARTIDTAVDQADHVMQQLAAVGLDMEDTGRALENQGVTAFHDSFQHLLDTLAAKAASSPGPGGPGAAVGP